MAHRFSETNGPTPTATSRRSRAADINKTALYRARKNSAPASSTAKANTSPATNGCWPNRPPNSKNPPKRKRILSMCNQSGVTVAVSRMCVSRIVTPNPLPMCATPRHRDTAITFDV